jgi:hypothetical protein
MVWFHSLGLITARRGRLEAARACDDAVLRSGRLILTTVMVVAILPVAAVRLTAHATSSQTSAAPQNPEQPLKTFYLAHADVQEVVTILNQMLTTTASRERPIITMSKSTNAILVRATPAVLDLIQNIIAAVDAPVRPGEALMTDASLIDALKGAAAIMPDVNRANALIALAQRHAMTPEMVSLYVTAAGGITSDAERARAFGQPVRLKLPAR